PPSRVRPHPLAWLPPTRRIAVRSARGPRRRAPPPPPTPAPPRWSRSGPPRAPGRAALWRRNARRAATSPTDPRDGVVHDAAVLLVAQTLAHHLLGHGNGDVGDLTPQLLARAPDAGLRLRARGLDQPLRHAPRRPP